MNVKECDFMNCKYCVKGQCTSKEEYEKCTFADFVRKKEIMQEVLTKQGAASILANDQTFKDWLERGIDCVRRLDDLTEKELK